VSPGRVGFRFTRRVGSLGVMRIGYLAMLIAVAIGCGDQDGSGPSRHVTAVPPPALRVSMISLHRLGGVPAGWKFSPPPGDAAVGHETFIRYGCPSCHRIAGEAFGGAGGGSQVGPELTGMGSHHPAGYFAESIVNPNAVLIDGPGYVGPDGLSIMPSYDSMTLSELTDIVAYLQSLTDDANDPSHEHDTSQPAYPNLSIGPPLVPPPPAGAQGSYVVMVYDVRPEQLGPFQRWFAEEGAAQLGAIDGCLGVDTYVDTTRERGSLISIIRFRDATTLGNFMATGAGTIGARWDEFIGPHGHFVYAFPPVYRVAALSSGPAPTGPPR
jgi:hypothetical protein